MASEGEHAPCERKEAYLERLLTERTRERDAVWADSGFDNLRLALVREDLTAALAREAKLVQAIRVSGHGVAIPGTANVDWCGTTGCLACDAVAESVAALPGDAS